MTLPTTMKALWYTAAKTFEIKQIPVPTPGDYDVLLKVRACGICGSDNHIDEGTFAAAFPLCTGHEITGEVAAFGMNVKNFKIGDRCVADPLAPCTRCFHCRRGEAVHCEKFTAVGVSKNGGFSEYISIDAKYLYKIFKMTDEEAVLVEPLSCVIRGVDMLKTVAGITALVLGSGPSGLLFAQMLKINGAHRVVIASNKGVKMTTARNLNCADEYVELDRSNPASQWDALKQSNPHGFDVVVEVTGSTAVVQESINFVGKRGTLLLYSVYDSQGLVQWSPLKIFLDEINIIGSFAQALTFNRAVAYIDSGKINVKGMVTDVVKLDDFSEALKKLKSRDVTKIAIKP